MFKYILVPATGVDTDAPVFSTALAVARLFGSHLEFLHVRIDVPQTLVSIATGDIGGGVGYDRILESLERDVAERQKKAELAFPSASLPLSSPAVCSVGFAERRIKTGQRSARSLFRNHISS